MSGEQFIPPEAIQELIEKDLANDDGKNTVQRAGEYYPKATKDAFERREYFLEYRSADLESLIGRELQFPIEASESQIAEELDLATLFIVSELTQGKWKDDFLKEYYGEYYTQLAEGKDSNKLINDIIENDGREVIIQELTGFFVEGINKELEKAEKHQYGTLTSGLELEVVPTDLSSKKALKEQVAQIDTLQDIGYPIMLDMLREIPLPKSPSAHEQLKATLELIEMGMIKPNQEIAIHLNFGGFERFDQDFFMLDQIIRTSNLFGIEINPWDSDEPPEEARKPLYEEDVFSPMGFPFKVREDGVIEFRGLPQMIDYKSYAKGIKTVESLCESLAAYQRQDLGKEDKTGKDAELAAVWKDLRNNTRHNFGTWFHYGEIDSYYNFEDAEEYWKHVSRLKIKVATVGMDRETLQENKRRSETIHNDVVEARIKASKLLKDAHKKGGID